MTVSFEPSTFVALSRFQDSSKRSEPSNADKAASVSEFVRTLINGADLARPVKPPANAATASDQRKPPNDFKADDKPSSTREAPTRGLRPKFQPKGQTVNILV